MTEDAILAKLQQKLGGPPEDEADVVYVLVEIRKYLDHVGPDPKSRQYPVLRTYCDWVVHICLEGRGAKTLLLSLDDALATKGTKQEREKALGTAFDHFSLTEFQNELRNLLRSVNLPLNLVDDHAWWGQFLKHYVAVVSDCPFVFKGEPRHNTAIKKATLKIFEHAEHSTEGMVNVIWVWNLEFADGSTRERSNTYGYRLA